VIYTALTIANQKSPRAKLGENSQNPGTAELAIVSAGLNAPAYWNGIKLMFEAFNSTLTIILCTAEAIQIGRICLSFRMVNPAAPGRKLDVSVCGLKKSVPK
jgi:hypothetical protein